MSMPVHITEKPEPGTRILAIVGPTAVGKTALALSIADSLAAEIVSVDSMQVYRGMDIGTSKPTPEERARLPFHMLDIAETDRDFAVALFKELSVGAILDIVGRGKVPLLVGGSGLYYRAVVDDLDFANVGGKDAFTSEMADVYSVMSDIELHAHLAGLDHTAAANIPPANRRRVLKAIEVARRGDRLMSERQASWSDFRSPYDLRVAGLAMERADLYRLVDERVDAMMAAGLEREVRGLREAGLRRGTPAGEALGYRQLLDYLDGRMTLQQAVDDIKARTRNYAKRQLTWFRKDPRIQWFMVELGPGEQPDTVAGALEKTEMLVLEYLSDKLEN